ncbi:MAG: hypothetical protein AAFO07_20560 [Bacteroidota bacterium]
MSTLLKYMLEQVNKLSRAEQLTLISTIALALSKEESVQVEDDALPESLIADKAEITKGDKSIDPTLLFGIWADHPRNIEDIRQKAWRRF